MTNLLPADLLARLGRIESLLESLVREKTVKDWYSTAEVAALLGKAEYTVREWCRQGRVRATKKGYARGSHPEWLIAHDELTRLRNEGLRSILDHRLAVQALQPDRELGSDQGRDRVCDAQ